MINILDGVMHDIWPIPLVLYKMLPDLDISFTGKKVLCYLVSKACIDDNVYFQYNWRSFLADGCKRSIWSGFGELDEKGIIYMSYTKTNRKDSFILETDCSRWKIAAAEYYCYYREIYEEIRI